MRLPSPSPLRRHWLLAPGTVFLNHGAFGACPKPMLKLQDRFRQQMEAEPVQFLWRYYEARLEPARQAVARFVGARAKDLVFVTNATTGVNAVLRSLPLKPGEEVLTTDHDYNACHNALVEAARAARARLVVASVPFPLRSADEVVEAVLRAVTRRTRLALLDHVTSATGLVLPVSRLVRELESRGVETLVDGAHAPGMVALDLARLGATYYTANLHKWVCAPKGTAFLWVREDRQHQMQPAVVSHGHNTPRPGYSSFQDRFDWAGTFDPSGWFCAGETLHWMGGVLPGGWKQLRARNHQLLVQARRQLCRALGVQAPCPENMLGAMATLPLPERFQGRPRRQRVEDEQQRLYDEFGIEVPLFRWGQPERRWLRLCAHVYNHPAEYEYLAQALAQL